MLLLHSEEAPLTVRGLGFRLLRVVVLAGKHVKVLVSDIFCLRVAILVREDRVF